MAAVGLIRCTNSHIIDTIMVNVSDEGDGRAELVVGMRSAGERRRFGHLIPGRRPSPAMAVSANPEGRPRGRPFCCAGLGRQGWIEGRAALVAERDLGNREPSAAALTFGAGADPRRA